MKAGQSVALAMLLLCAGCSPRAATDNDGANRVADAGEQPARGAAPTGEPLAVVTVAAPDGACAFTWNGNPITRDAMVRQGGEEMRAAIARRGGLERMSEQDLPFARVEAAAELPYQCVALAFGDLQSAGFLTVRLRPAGTDAGADRSVTIMNTHQGPYRPVAIVQMGSGDRIAWDEQPIDLATLRNRASGLRGTAVTPDEFVIAPAADTRFGALHAAAGAVHEAGLEMYVSGCRRDAPADAREHVVWGSEHPAPRC